MGDGGKMLLERPAEALWAGVRRDIRIRPAAEARDDMLGLRRSVCGKRRRADASFMTAFKSAGHHDGAASTSTSV
jgi:hypothetical protein